MQIGMTNPVGVDGSMDPGHSFGDPTGGSRSIPYQGPQRFTFMCHLCQVCHFEA